MGDDFASITKVFDRLTSRYRRSASLPDPALLSGDTLIAAAEQRQAHRQLADPQKSGQPQQPGPTQMARPPERGTESFGMIFITMR